MSETALKRRGLPVQVKMRHEPHFVEELTTRQESAVGKMLPIASLGPNPRQPRTTVGDIEELASSIRDKGILEPLLVRRTSAPPNSGAKPYEIVAGERRYRAALLAGLDEVPAIELEVSDQEAIEIALVENLQRKDLTPFEEADGYRTLAELHGYTHQQIASATAKSRTAITESLSILAMPSRVRDAAIELGVTARSVLVEIARLKTEEEMLAALTEMSSGHLTREDLRRRPASRPASPGAKRSSKPYRFEFRAPDKRYRLSLSFRQTTVERTDLIRALEEILGELRHAQATDTQGKGAGRKSS